MPSIVENVNADEKCSEPHSIFDKPENLGGEASENGVAASESGNDFKHTQTKDHNNWGVNVATETNEPSHSSFEVMNDSNPNIQRSDTLHDNVQYASAKPLAHSATDNITRQSVWSHVYSELTRGYLLEHDEAKYTEKQKRIYNVFKVPLELEKFMTYGIFQCLDAFLYVFTFLPLRIIMAFLKFIICGSLSWCFRRKGRVLEPAQICDMLKGVILIVCYMLMQYVDLSMMYHMIRGQAIIKLYLFFNMLEIADRLFSSFGQDTLDSLFWTAAEARVTQRRQHMHVILHLLLAITYVFIHCVLVLFQASTLNVAFNSHNKALLTIMMSNNFVELKGSVFKKFEKTNLFQMSCSDVRERFHFMILLAIVCTRNLTEFSWNMEYVLVLIPNVLMVLGSELVVDWVKHAFITKFNEIPATVYKEYTTHIAYDMIMIREKKSHSDHMDLVSRRMGFIPIPLAVVLVHVITQSLKIATWSHVALAVLFYFCMVSVKVLNSIILLGKACGYTEEAKNKQKPPETTPTPVPPSPPGHKRRLSDSNCLQKTAGVEELHRSCIKRSRSLGGKMNVTFSVSDSLENDNTYNTATSTCSDSSLLMTSAKSSAHDTGANPLDVSSKLLMSNSTVSLDNVGLNEEFISDTTNDPVKLTEGSELKQRKPPPKPLHEIDRYTMCSNRII